MGELDNGWSVLRRWGRVAVVGAMCAVMVVPPGMMAEGVDDHGAVIPAERHAKPLTGQERELQALNRFTFGPRPGDVAAVRAMGLQRWFEMQLHPERIDDATFEAEMQRFPAAQLAAAEMMQRFPSQGMVRRLSKEGGTLPGDAVERAIYADAEYADAARAKIVVGSTQDNKAVMNGAPGVVGGAQDSAGMRETVGTAPGSAVEEVLRLAPEERLGKMVAMSPGEMMAFREGMTPKDRAGLLAGLPPAQVEAVEAMVEGPERVVAEEAMETRLLRDVDSQRQLQAVMTEFWLNHFNVYLRKNEVEPYLVAEYEQKTILPHAVGKFEDLLVATAESPAMLMYLDNWESIGPDSVAAERADQMATMRPKSGAAQLPKGINENYGRELMELHTLGVGGGYTQQDVIEVAKCFTGWTIDRPFGGGGAPARVGRDDAAPGEFVFEANRHEPGTKVVLGHSIREGGMKEGLEVLHLLATSPATAHFISQELAVRFVSDTPPPALVDRMAATFLKSDGDIAAVLTTMFRSKEFWEPEVYRAKVKTPLEFLASAVRAGDATVTNPLPLVQTMNRLGMPVWGMATPNGYGWTAEDWVSSNALISRMNVALALSGNRVPGTRMDFGAVGSADSTVAMEKALEEELLEEPATEKTRAAVMAEAGSRGSAPVDTMAGLLLGSPEFQRR